MEFYPISYPQLPETTASKARAVHGNGNMYITLGNNLEHILENLIPTERLMLDPQVGRTYCLLILITAIQYEEELTDRQFANALPERIDIKYALHLPISYPGIDPQTLCEFRQHLLEDPLDLESFQELLERLSSLGMYYRKPEKSVKADTVLITLLMGGILERAIEDFSRVIEKLAVENPAGLGSITISHWLKQYSHRIRPATWPKFDAGGQSLLERVKIDIRDLLDQVVKIPSIDQSNWEEIRALRETWEVISEAFVQDGTDLKGYQRRLKVCV